MHLGGSEVIWIAVAAIVIFGAAKIPQLMKGVGQGIKEFKQAVREDDPPAKPVETETRDSNSANTAPKT